MAVTRPSNLSIPFANTGAKNTIPVASQIGITPGAASYTDGFPPLTMTPIPAGGVPPSGLDVNGIYNAISAHTVFQNAGGKYRFDAALATAIGGYPVGFVLQDDAGLSEYVNILANNSTDFNSTPASIGVSWMPYAGKVLQNNSLVYSTDTGTANTCVVSYAPAITALVDGMVLWFKAKVSNTGATTLNVNGLGAQPVVGGAHSALQGGEIIANGQCVVVWNATLSSFVLIGCTGASLQVAPATNSNHALQLGQATGRLLRTSIFSNTGTQKISIDGGTATTTGATTFTSLAATTKVRVRVQAGGGSGAGTTSTVAANASVGAGGGAGGYAESILTSGFSGGITVTVGIGGTAQSSSGVAGGSSSFGTLLSATGGNGANAISQTNTFPVMLNSATGGTGTGGNIFNTSGGSGIQAMMFSNTNILSGSGGASVFGAGASSSTGTAAGVDAPTLGSGSGGASSSGTGGAVASGFGGNGIVIVEEYA